MEAVRALIRRNAKGLRLLGVPVLGMSADLLIGAGCVAEVHSSAVSLGEAGLAPRFSEAVERGDARLDVEHLLLAVLHEPGGRGQRAVVASGRSPRAVERRLFRALRGQPAESSSASPSS